LIRKTLYIIFDRIKRWIIDTARKSNRLKTPMDYILQTLEPLDLLPANAVAVDLFGMYGLWTTRDIYPYCRRIELWEIDPVYARWAKRFLADAAVFCGDSIKAMSEGRLSQQFYDFILIDNPLGCFDKYCEHFEALPLAMKYIHRTVMVLNVIPSVKPVLNNYQRSDQYINDWILRRRLFYQKDNAENITVSEILIFYRNYFETNGFVVKFLSFVPRTPVVLFLYASVSRSSL